jgi:hypothetical protein
MRAARRSARREERSRGTARKLYGEEGAEVGGELRGRQPPQERELGGQERCARGNEEQGRAPGNSAGRRSWRPSEKTRLRAMGERAPSRGSWARHGRKVGAPVEGRRREMKPRGLAQRPGELGETSAGRTMADRNNEAARRAQLPWEIRPAARQEISQAEEINKERDRL